MTDLGEERVPNVGAGLVKRAVLAMFLVVAMSATALVSAVGRLTKGESMSVGRDGASDAVSFLQAGIPAVEFGPAGAGHHGPEEWVSISSLARYRQALCDFVSGLPDALEGGSGLRAVEGGLA